MSDSSKLWYLATPYAAFPDGLDLAYDDACWNVAMFMEAGIPVFSPVAHFHGVAGVADIDPRDYEIWMPACEPFMEMSRGIIVCKLQGWEGSRGIQTEIAAFEMMKKPVVFYTPGYKIRVDDFTHNG